MNIPEKILYTNSHEWVDIKDNIATIGITDYAQHELGDIVFIDLPDIDNEIESQQCLCSIEAVKAVEEIISPLSGKIVEFNEQLADNPELINQDPYGEGWIAKIDISNPDEVEDLLDYKGYEELIR